MPNSFSPCTSAEFVHLLLLCVVNICDTVALAPPVSDEATHFLWHFNSGHRIFNVLTRISNNPEETPRTGCKTVQIEILTGSGRIQKSNTRISAVALMK